MQKSTIGELIFIVTLAICLPITVGVVTDRKFNSRLPTPKEVGKAMGGACTITLAESSKPSYNSTDGIFGISNELLCYGGDQTSCHYVIIMRLYIFVGNGQWQFYNQSCTDGYTTTCNANYNTEAVISGTDGQRIPTNKYWQCWVYTYEGWCNDPAGWQGVDTAVFEFES
jgi:hypothetical protein